jgi:hypothetical protein
MNSSKIKMLKHVALGTSFLGNLGAFLGATTSL